jgi:hypothetical protein
MREKTGQRRQRDHWPAEVYERAQDLYNDPEFETPARIQRALAVEFGDDKSPTTPKTISNWIEGGWLTKTDEDVPWSLADATGSEAAIVLRVLRGLIEDGRPKPTRRLVRWLVRIATACPDLAEADPSLLYICAARAKAGYVQRVETFLAFTPWRDGGLALAEAVARGRVPFQVAFDGGYEAEVAAAQLRLRGEVSNGR